MKNLIIIFLIVSFFSCKREEELPLSDIPGHIAMQDNRGSNFQLFIKNGTYFTFPGYTPSRWSHDGSRLIITGFEGDQQYCSIVDAHTLVEIIRFYKREFFGLCWSPNDEEIAYTLDNNLVRIHLSTLEQHVISLPSTYQFDGDMDWSPDGNRFVLFGQNLDFFLESALCSINVNGSDYKVLAIGPFQHARWSPDGSTIAYDDFTNLNLMNADGSNQRLVIRSASSPCWSSDGSILMFTHVEYTSWTSSKIDIRAREIGGDQRERVVYEGCGLIDWCPVE